MGNPGTSESPTMEALELGKPALLDVVVYGSL